MSSDIDIEEHDFREHPSFKKIFPGLSWIKTEVIDLDDEESPVCDNIKIEANSETQCFEEIHQETEPLQDYEEVIISDNEHLGVKTKYEPNRENEPIILVGEKCLEVKETNELKHENIDTEPLIVDYEQCEDVIQTNDSVVHEIVASEASVGHIKEPNLLLTTNMIVLGSNVPTASHIAENSDSNLTKTNLHSESRPERDPFAAKVILKDWGYILEQHPFYCLECSILFPSQSAFLAHTATKHSLLVPIEETEVEELKFVDSKQAGGLGHMKCPICGYFFKTRRFYLAHTQSKHDTVKLQPINEVFNGSCMFCSGKRYKTIRPYYKHISKYHSDLYHTKYLEIEPPSTNVGTKLSPSNKARKSTAKVDDRINVARKSTSKPMQRDSTSDETIENPKINYFICPICGIHYQHMWQYVAHCNTNHQAIYLSPKRRTFTGSCDCGFETTSSKNLNNHISKEHRILFKKIATDIQEYYCCECDITFATLNSYNIHKIKHDYNDDNEKDKHDRKTRRTEDVSLQRQSYKELDQEDVDEGNFVIIPKETIFKCPLCDVHSMSCRTVFFHFLNCTAAKLKIVCDICDRSLRYQDVDSHRLQHRLMSTINAIEITREAFYKLVLVCTKCKVGFDGFSINTNHAIECQKKEGTLCQKCNLKIAPKCIIKHEKMHSGNTEPLIVEFLCGKLNKLKELIGSEKNSLYYCKVCKSYDLAKHAEYHRTDLCLQNKSFRICRFCGLRFGHESFAEHILDHQNNSFDLMNIKIFDIHTDEVIKLKIPEWNKFAGDCKDKCSGEKRKRESANEKTVYCEECQENYHELAYKVHLQYHEYTNRNHIDAEIMQKYLTMQTLWNIVYLCQGCNITFDNYDLAVEHSQDHLTKNPKTRSDKCTKCDLIFEKQSFERHKNLHKGAKINRDSLCVLSFNFKNLLSKSWDDVFEAISDEQKSHILSKSVYNLYRYIRLELNYDGPSTHTLYKCAVCNAIVDKTSLQDHAYNMDACKDRDTVSCSSCDLVFTTQDSLKEHELNHLPANKVSIISFNIPKHFSLNNGLIQQLRFNNLKAKTIKSTSTAIFYKCVDCGVGIQSLLNIKKHNCSNRKLSRQYVKCELCKLSYRLLSLESHMSLHKKLDKYYVALFQNGNLVLRGQTKLVILYECSKCQICTLKKLPAHTCVPQVSCIVCDTCGLQFLHKTYRMHMALHENLPNLARNNFVIIKYTPDLAPFDNKPTSHKLTGKLMPIKPMSGKASNVKPVPNNPMSRLLYKCTCNNLFVKWRKLREHVNKCKEDLNATKCKCGLNFHASSLQDHLNVHFNCTSIKSYLVASVNVGKAAIEKSRKKWLWYCTLSKTYYNNIKNLIGHLKRNKPGPNQTCTICRIRIASDSFEDHMELHHEDNEFNHRQLHKLALRMILTDNLKMSSQEPSQPDTKNRPSLYTCERCDLYFSTRLELESHFNKSLHNKKNRVQCNICNYFFAPLSLRRHKHNHHYKRKYKRADFLIITSLNNKLEKNESTKNSSFPTAIHDFGKMPENIKTDACTLHRCGKCELHFMLKKFVNSHILQHSKIGRKRYASHSCSICGLEFLSRSLAQHMLYHHEKLNLQLKDFKIRVYTAPHTYTITKIKPNKNQSTKRKIQSDRVVHAKKMKFVPRANRDPPKQPAPSPKPPPIAISQPVASNSAYFENSSQIFRCAECNVCFTNYMMCYDHTLDHRPLDPTEYIGCNLCDFQLLCECLGVHRKSHREGTFNIDELIVKEFQPRDGAPLIKTYLARDLLEANVTSTTTNCS